MNLKELIINSVKILSQGKRRKEEGTLILRSAKDKLIALKSNEQPHKTVIVVLVLVEDKMFWSDFLYVGPS